MLYSLSKKSRTFSSYCFILYQSHGILELGCCWVLNPDSPSCDWDSIQPPHLHHRKFQDPLRSPYLFSGWKRFSATNPTPADNPTTGLSGPSLSTSSIANTKQCPTRLHAHHFQVVAATTGRHVGGMWPTLQWPRSPSQLVSHWQPFLALWFLHPRHTSAIFRWLSL